MGTAAATAAGTPGPAPKQSRRTLGLCLLMLTAGIWVAASFISEALVTPLAGQDVGAVHPFLLTYLATSLFTLYLPFLFLRARISGLRQPRLQEGTPEQMSCSGPSQGLTSTSSSAAKATHDVAMHAAAWALPLWFSAQLAFNASLALTSVTSNTILSSTSSLFTFGLSIMFLNEQFTAQKLLSIFACIAGTALITLSDAESGADQRSGAWGDALTVASSCLYAGYTVVLRKKMPAEDDATEVAAFFGYIGLFSTVSLAPVLFLLVHLGVFSLSTIPPAIYLVILVEGLLAYVLSDYLWARAIMLLGPTIATLGLSVQIPLAAAVELLLGRANWLQTVPTVLMMVTGTALILGGFCHLTLTNLSSGTASPDSGKWQQHGDEIMPTETTTLLPGQQCLPKA